MRPWTVYRKLKHPRITNPIVSLPFSQSPDYANRAGFSVAFGSTGCSGLGGGRCTVRAAGANVECRRHELLGGVRGMRPPAFLEPELVNREGLLRR